MAYASARGPGWRAPGAAPRAALGGGTASASGHWLGSRARSAPRAGPDPQRYQAGSYSGEPGDRRGLADGLRHCLAPAAGAPGPRAARDDGGHAGLHGPGTDRAYEPLD